MKITSRSSLLLQLLCITIIASIALLVHGATNQDEQNSEPILVNVDPTVDISAASSSSSFQNPVAFDEKVENEQALERFKAYLSVNTSHPNPSYDKAVQFLVKLADKLHFPYQIVQLDSGLDVVVLTYRNLLDEYKHSTESIMMNSHTDVVPADPAKWNSDPFVATTTSDGKIFARGAQDMKSVGMQYVEAVHRLKLRNVKLRYTIRIVFVPEEEVGAKRGMIPFLQTKEFKDMNVVFSFDEGIPIQDSNSLSIYYGENIAWWFKVTCEGNVGHGSQFIKNTATSQLSRYMRRAFDFRDEQERLITLSNEAFDESDVVTINMNAMEGGSTTSINVVPRQVHGYFDSRIPPHYNLTEMSRLYTEVWTEGTNCKVTWVQQGLNNPVSDLQFPIIHETIQFFRNRYTNVKLRYFPAATDARFVRGVGIPCLGISLLSGVPMLLHDHNEYITEEIFIRGIRQYEELLIHLSK